MEQKDPNHPAMYSNNSNVELIPIMHLSSFFSHTEINKSNNEKDSFFPSTKKHELIHYEHGPPSPESAFLFPPIMNDYFISSNDPSFETCWNSLSSLKDNSSSSLNYSTILSENSCYNYECNLEDLSNYKNDLTILSNSSLSPQNVIIDYPLVSIQSELPHSNSYHFLPLNNNASNSNYSPSSSSATSLYFTNQDNMYLENSSYSITKTQCDCTSKSKVEYFTTPMEHNFSTVLNAKNYYEIKLDNCKCSSSEILNIKLNNENMEQMKTVEQIRKNNEICHILSPFRKYRVCFIISC